MGIYTRRWEDLPKSKVHSNYLPIVISCSCISCFLKVQQVWCVSYVRHGIREFKGHGDTHMMRRFVVVEIKQLASTCNDEMVLHSTRWHSALTWMAGRWHNESTSCSLNRYKHTLTDAPTSDDPTTPPCVCIPS